MENEKDLELKGCLLRENPDPRGYKIARFVPKRDPVPDTEFMLPVPNSKSYSIRAIQIHVSHTRLHWPKIYPSTGTQKSGWTSTRT